MAGLAALVLLGGMSLFRFPGTVAAAEYDAAQEIAQVQAEDETAKRSAYGQVLMENGPYGPYEMTPQELQTMHVQVQQFRQQWQQNRLYIVAEGELPLDPASEMEPESLMLPVSQEELDAIAAENARIAWELSQIWHNPLVLDTYVSSPFGMRWHPVYGYYRMHNGVDLDSDWGDPVRASRAGVVLDEGWNRYYGYYVMIDHGDGFVSEYFHLSDYFVEEGQSVSACEVIGQVGSTGVSTGSHLHFGVLYEDEYVDPEDYLDFN